MAVDVFVPVYKEPVEIVDLTVAAAAGLRGAEVRVWVLDDGNDDAMRDLAARHGVGYIRRDEHTGAKAGNINNALTRDGRAVHRGVRLRPRGRSGVPRVRRSAGWTIPKVAFVQTPQYYANGDQNRIAAASWSQQALFFGAIARGKDGLDAVFCCGTNVLFRREAFESVGGFPTNSLTEDYELSIWLHELGWKSVYVPEVLSRGLGPEDMAAYVSQQQRWARGCLSGLPRALRAKLPFKLKAQYVLSASYFLSGWTVLIYMSFPVIRLHRRRPADRRHHRARVPVALRAVLRRRADDGRARRRRLVHVRRLRARRRELLDPLLSTIYTVLRKEGSFVVTPKKGAGARQPAAVMPALVVVGDPRRSRASTGCCANRDAATINNVCFAAVHVSILLTGCWPALAKPRVDEPRVAGARGGRRPEPHGA